MIDIDGAMNARMMRWLAGGEDGVLAVQELKASGVEAATVLSWVLTSPLFEAYAQASGATREKWAIQAIAAYLAEDSSDINAIAETLMRTAVGYVMSGGGTLSDVQQAAHLSWGEIEANVAAAASA